MCSREDVVKYHVAKSRGSEAWREILPCGPVRLLAICSRQAGPYLFIWPRSTQKLQMSVGYKANMGSYCIHSSRILRKSSVNLPDFLIPAFHTIKKARPFSTTLPCASRIGEAPVSLPPDVTVTIIEPPVRPKHLVTRVQAPRMIQVEGPLGLQPQTSSIREIFQIDIPN